MSAFAGRLGGAVPWGPVDQAVSAAGTALVMVIASRRLDATGLGAFAVAISAALIVVALCRAWSSQTFTVVHAADDRRRQVRNLVSALVSGVCLAAVAGLIVAGVGLFLGGAVGPVMIVVGLGLPFVVAQDGLRLSMFVVGPAWVALLSDAVWLATLGALFLVPGFDSPVAIAAWWVVGAALALIVPLVRVVADDWRGGDPAWTWAVRNRRVALGFLADTSLVVVYGHSIPLILALVASIEESGVYRIALTAVGPMATVVVGASIQLLPELVRMETNEQRWARARKFSTRLCVAGLAYAAVLWLVPVGVGEAIVGSVWSDARSTAWILALSTAGGAIIQGALVVLRSVGATPEIARLRAVLFPAQFGAVVVGAAVAGPLGAALLLGAGNWLSSPLWWITARRRGFSAPRDAELGRAR